MEQLLRFDKMSMISLPPPPPTNFSTFDSSLSRGGVYDIDGTPSLSLRILNSRARQLVNVELHIYLIEKGWDLFIYTQNEKRQSSQFHPITRF